MNKNKNLTAEETGRYWDGNADAWTELVRAGYDHYRDLLNTPGFFSILPDIKGKLGLDIGCGEGHNTRLLAKVGAKMTALDISERFILHARGRENIETLGIAYLASPAQTLPFDGDSFDFVTAFMSLMDMPEIERVFGEVFRVLKPGGFFQFSILHPCFITPTRKNVFDTAGKVVAAELAGYFDGDKCSVDEWMFNGAPANRPVDKFRIPYYHRTLSEWLNIALGSGLTLEYCHEPCPGEEVAEKYPSLAYARVTAFFLHLRFRKNDGKL
ncbi:MAG: hypothetical protein A2Y33_12220 [Spirochaetes bacterium GWF1_51_8]|nr:MAG: hypothetical protein A2Y33_12220 [Spirochaetes bacterium GWF1_51_8]